jgi:hypothetical protein
VLLLNCLVTLEENLPLAHLQNFLLCTMKGWECPFHPGSWDHAPLFVGGDGFPRADVIAAKKQQGLQNCHKMYQKARWSMAS